MEVTQGWVLLALHVVPDLLHPLDADQVLQLVVSVINIPLVLGFGCFNNKAPL